MKPSTSPKRKSIISSPSPKKKRSSVDRLSLMLQGLKIKPISLKPGPRAVDFRHCGPTSRKISVSNALAQFRNHESSPFNKQSHLPGPPSTQSERKTRLQLVRRSRSLSLIPYSVAGGPGSPMIIHSNPSTPSSSPNPFTCGKSSPAQQRPLSFFLRQCINEATLPRESHTESLCTHSEDLDSPMPKSSASSLYPDAGVTPPGTPMDVVQFYQ